MCSIKECKEAVLIPRGDRLPAVEYRTSEVHPEAEDDEIFVTNHPLKSRKDYLDIERFAKHYKREIRIGFVARWAGGLGTSPNSVPIFKKKGDKYRELCNHCGNAINEEGITATSQHHFCDSSCLEQFEVKEIK